MSEPATTENGNGTLASIRRLERTLAARLATTTVAEGNLEAAHTEAASILAAAEQNAVEASAGRRAQAVALADRDAAEIRRRTDVRAAELRESAAAQMAGTIDKALTLIVGAGAEGAR